MGSFSNSLEGSPFVVLKDNPPESPSGNQKLLGEATRGNHGYFSPVLGSNASQGIKDIGSKGQISVNLVTDEEQLVLGSEIQKLQEMIQRKHGSM